MSPVSWGDIFTLPLRGDKIMELRHNAASRLARFLRRGYNEVLTSVRSWRNWQTHQLEGLAVAIPWWFESTRPHHIPILEIKTCSATIYAWWRSGSLRSGTRSPDRAHSVEEQPA